MRSGISICGAAAILAAALLCAACIPHGLVSWSPDGRQVAFVDIEGDDDALWLCDAETGRAERLSGEGTPIPGAVVSCRFLPSGRRLLVAHKREGGDVDLVLWNLDADEPPREIARDIEPFNFDAAQGGRSVFYLKRRSADETTSATTVLMERDTLTTGECIVAEFPGSMECPRPNPNATKILLSGQEGIWLYDVCNATSSVLLPIRKERTENGDKQSGAMWPAWLDEHRIVYAAIGDGDEERGELATMDVDSATTRLLHPSIYPLVAPAVSPDGNSVAVAVVAEGRKDYFQVAVVDARSGRTEFLTRELFGAAFGQLDPRGKRLAFMECVGPKPFSFGILDLRTGRKTAVWRDEEESFLADAERSASQGRGEEGAALIGNLLEFFPETRLAEKARCRLVEIRLCQPQPNVEAATETLKSATWERKTLEEIVAPLFWRYAEGKEGNPPAEWVEQFVKENNE